jgi:Na+/melibiose symporter-like transporter
MLSGIDREVHSADSSQGVSILFLRVSFVSMAFILPLISIYFLNKYPLSKKKVEQLRMDLEARRGA